jgi:segregation and condensation protein B
MDTLQVHIEAIVFASDQPVSVEELTAFISRHNGMEIPQEELLSILNMSMEKYQSDRYPFELVSSGGGYQFRTKAHFHDTVSAFLQRNTVKKLTTAALETLAIIAYKQPITKSEIETIRGVSCDYTVQKLMERELIEIKGRSNDVGRPLLYATSSFFLDYFGINSLDELPKLKEFTESENQIGEKENIIQNN